MKAMVTLENFESYCQDPILERGQNYYKEGLIYTFESLGDGRFSSIVIGTDPYAVNVEVDENGTVEELHCTCPFDLGAICKHKVAVLHRIRDYLNGANTHSDAHLQALRKELAGYSKADLLDMIMHVASVNLESRRKLFEEADVKDGWDPEVFWIGT